MKARLTVLWLLCGVGLAISPAEDLYVQSTQTLQENYFGYSSRDLPALVQQYGQQLQDTCKPQADNCPVEVGRSTLEALLNELADPHTYYLYPEESDSRDRAQNGEDSPTPRIGVTSAPLPGGLGRVVLFVRDDGPAYTAGIKPGDLLVEVDGKPLGNDPSGGSNLIAEYAQKTTPFEMKVRRGKELLTFTLQGEVLMQAPLPTLTTGGGLPEGVGLIQIPDFEAYRQVGRKVHALVRQARQQKLYALILDLRNNGGGLVIEWISAAAAFSPNPGVLNVRKDQTSRLEYRQGTLQMRVNDEFAGNVYTIRMPELWTGKMVVLVNGETASSGEYFAYYLQKMGIKVIGEPTYGLLNTAADSYELPDQGLLVVTTIKSALPDGTLYPERLTPDILVNDDLSSRAGTLVDPLVRRALEELEYQP
ncbi:S41 family peptidase [Deinococcus misasensis]|uniref:S41 family peptidase n=1 Tax=Deinococcus misasensis TaxID=392413 RepID=UPI000AFA4AD9|nr:S41 family peptidase [Deinococcus misasensis]